MNFLKYLLKWKCYFKKYEFKKK